MNQYEIICWPNTKDLDPIEVYGETPQKALENLFAITGQLDTIYEVTKATDYSESYPSYYAATARKEFSILQKRANIVTLRQFLDAYEESNTKEELAAKINCEISSVNLRISAINLRLERSGKELLNKLK